MRTTTDALTLFYEASKNSSPTKKIDGTRDQSQYVFHPSPMRTP